MIKIKTIKSVKKRFKKTAKGNFIYKHANMRHILTKKKSKRKNFLRKKELISNKDKNMINICLPYL